MSESNSTGDHDELESARILIQENLYEEAKRVLFRLLTRVPDPQSVVYRRARELLARVETIELNDLMNKEMRVKSSVTVEDPTLLISRLERDLRIESFEEETLFEDERWNVEGTPGTAQGLFDLAVAFYEMGCFGDAIRELKRAEKKIRIEESFLGELGISVVALMAQAKIKIGSAFQARMDLEPVLVEPDLPHEQKIVLYYTMGLAEQALGEKNSAMGWFRKVCETDPDFKDVQQRIRLLSKTV